MWWELLVVLSGLLLNIPLLRSDVAGQVLPLLGMDWTQNGVVRETHSSTGMSSHPIHIPILCCAIGGAVHCHFQEWLQHSVPVSTGHWSGRLHQGVPEEGAQGLLLLT